MHTNMHYLVVVKHHPLPLIMCLDPHTDGNWLENVFGFACFRWFESVDL